MDESTANLLAECDEFLVGKRFDIRGGSDRFQEGSKLRMVGRFRRG
jgi:hypothetical protein